MSKKDDNLEKSPDLKDLEKILNEADFSAGRKESVWKKIMSELQSQNSEIMSMDELDMVAGGLHKPPEDNGKPKKGGS